MKNFGYILLGLLVSASLSGCKLIDELRTFTIPYSVNFTVPSSTLINLPIDLGTPPVTTESEQKFEDEGVESEWVESIKLTSMILEIESPQGEDFSFLESISIYMNTSGQPEVLIADKVAVPQTSSNVLQLDVKNADIYPYISQSSFSLRTLITTDESITQSIDIRADMKVEVKATIPGS